MAAHYTEAMMQSVIAAEERALAAEQRAVAAEQRAITAEQKAAVAEAAAAAEQRAAVAEAKLAAELKAAVAENEVKNMRDEIVAAKVDLARLKSSNPGPEAKADAAEEKAKVAQKELAKVQSDFRAQKNILDTWVKGCGERDEEIRRNRETIDQLRVIIGERDAVITAMHKAYRQR